jgi:hypothetical protein
VDTRSREENAAKQKIGVPVLIQSEQCPISDVALPTDKNKRGSRFKSLRP